MDWVQIALRNLSAQTVIVQVKSNLATIAAANEVLKMLAPKMVTLEQDLGKDDTNRQSIKMIPLDEEDQKKLNNKLDLGGIEDWNEEQKEQVKQLFHEYGCLFALNSNDLVHTNIVKHNIRLNYYTPFKECYR